MNNVTNQEVKKIPTPISGNFPTDEMKVKPIIEKVNKAIPHLKVVEINEQSESVKQSGTNTTNTVQTEEIHITGEHLLGMIEANQQADRELNSLMGKLMKIDHKANLKSAWQDLVGFANKAVEVIKQHDYQTSYEKIKVYTNKVVQVIKTHDYRATYQKLKDFNLNAKLESYVLYAELREICLNSSLTWIIKRSRVEGYAPVGVIAFSQNKDVVAIIVNKTDGNYELETPYLAIYRKSNKGFRYIWEFQTIQLNDSHSCINPKGYVTVSKDGEFVAVTCYNQVVQYFKHNGHTDYKSDWKEGVIIENNPNVIDFGKKLKLFQLTGTDPVATSLLVFATSKETGETIDIDYHGLANRSAQQVK